jgi:hypothetical protein
MKAGQNTIVRWVAKLVAKQARQVSGKPVSGLRAIEPEQLRQISGGITDSSEGPNRGW